MAYIPFRVKKLFITDDKILLSVSYFDDSLKEMITKEYNFIKDNVVYLSLGYIKNIEEQKEHGFKLSNLFKKLIPTMDEKKIKDYNLKEDIFIDMVVWENDKAKDLLFFRIDLTTFNYRSFFNNDISFSSFVNIRKFIFYLISYFGNDKVDEIVLSFMNLNSFSKIQYFSNVYEFQDYVLSKLKEKKIAIYGKIDDN